MKGRRRSSLLELWNIVLCIKMHELVAEDHVGLSDGVRHSLVS